MIENFSVCMCMGAMKAFLNLCVSEFLCFFVSVSVCVCVSMCKCVYFCVFVQVYVRLCVPLFGCAFAFVCKSVLM